jgi:hypothetical protein
MVYSFTEVAVRRILPKTERSAPMVTLEITFDVIALVTLVLLLNRKKK